MLDLLFRKKPSIDSIVLPDLGWKKEKSTKGHILWVNAEQTIGLSLHYFDGKPDVPASKEIDAFITFYREQMVSLNGGLIEVNFSDLKKYKAIRTIFKIPQEPEGMSYIASLTIPFQKCSYVIKIQAPEFGVTGMREIVVSSRLLHEGKIDLGDEGYEHWLADPYDKTFDQGTLMNRSEDALYDADFEDHHLTKARKLLNRIEGQVEFRSELERLKTRA